MIVLVALFVWIYARDRQQRVRLWMSGWCSIVAHFAGMLLASFSLIPAKLAEWLAYATLIFAASAFFLSVCRTMTTTRRRMVFWLGIVTPALGYWTCMVAGVQGPLPYRAILAVLLLSSGLMLATLQSGTDRIAPIALAIVPGAWIAWRVAPNVESGMDFILFEAFAVTGWYYWRYFRRFTPGVLLTSLAFLAWGLVFPIAEICGALHIDIPGDHVVWDLPKYFVAFGMILTLFENQTENLQREVVERKRAEEAAQRLVQPVLRLQSMVRRIAEGDLSARADIRSAQEIDTLAQSFNSMADSLLQRDRILESVRFAAQRFLSAAAWQTAILEVLAKIGQAAEVGRVFMLERKSGPAEGLAGAVLYEWAAPGVPCRSGAPGQAEVRWSGEEWGGRAERLARGEVVAVEDGGGQPGSSILVPLEVAGQWFGALGFDDFAGARIWSEAERDSFHSAARMLGAAITRQQAQEYVDNILQSMGEALLVTDAEQRIRRVNPSALRLLGYQEAQLIGQPASRVIVEGDVPAHSIAIERIYRTRGGRRIPVLFSSAELRTDLGSLEGYVCVAQELTELKRIEAELVAARDAAEEANRAKSTFLANMSHELRTPLNAIIGYSQMLQEDYIGPEQAEVLSDLAKVERSGHALLAIINDVLDLSKIEAGRVQMEMDNVDVAAILQDVHNAVQPLARQQGNVVRMECGEQARMAYADLQKLRQSVLNLVNNACKFTENGEVEVQVERVAEQGREWTEVRVKDTGIGIAAEHLGRLFQPFTQVDGSATRRYSGTGLGLAISQKFCHMMGGNITVQSAPGRGSCFALRVPAHAPALRS